MEAMALDVVAIGTAAGGVGENIFHGENGLFVPPKSPGSLVEAVVRLMDDPSLRERLADAGQRTIVKKFYSRIGAVLLFERLFGHVPVDTVVGLGP